VINARGIYTDLGGWRPSARVWQAMTDANQHYIDMADLLGHAGRAIAELIGAEAARITPGATAGIALAVAACMTGTDPDKLRQIPDVTGLKHEVLIQRAHRYPWDKFVMLPGGRLTEVGDDTGTSAEQLEHAFSDNTVAVLHAGHLAGADGAIPLAAVARISHAHGVPVVADAAYLNFPIDRFQQVLDDGADLAVFSAKYFGGPNTGGFVCGRRDLIEAVAANDFSKAGTVGQHAFGRAFKLDRQLIVGVVEALREWTELDHGARFENYERLVQRIAGTVRDVPGIELQPMFLTMEEDLVPEPINCLVIRVDPSAGLTASHVTERLRDGNPSIYVHQWDDRLVVDVECVNDDEAVVIGQRLRAALSPQFETAG
jgi:L-seryl-tRNA(Ser) seleniumtransferase